MILTNTTLHEIGKTLLDARSVILFPHESPDGDSIGSCVALCRGLRQQGIDAWTLVDGPLPDLIAFIDGIGTDGSETENCCTADQSCIADPDLCVYVDCCGENRITGRVDKFRAGRKSLCIDHHRTAESKEDLYYIDGDEAATTQIIYKLLKEMEIEPDRSMRDAIYTGICTDTGNFKYSNTTEETHLIAADLVRKGIDHNEIMVRLYQNVDPRQVRVESMALEKVEFIASGKAAMACVTKELLHQCGAQMEHADNLINVIRDMKGVEVAAVLKEYKTEETKVSLRAKSYADVGTIAEKLGGGGHTKAAGGTIHKDMETAKAMVVKALEEAMTEEPTA